MGLLYLFTLCDNKTVLATLSFDVTFCALFVFWYDTVMMVPEATATCVCVCVCGEVVLCECGVCVCVWCGV
jgi:hypothetical protein